MINGYLEEETVKNILTRFNTAYKAKDAAPVENSKLAGMIDHTLLKPDASEKEIIILCEEAIKYKFASVCVNPAYVELCSKLLTEHLVKVCTVIGFPLGANTTPAKIFEAEKAIEQGAEEIDMVLNIGKLKDKNYDYVQEEIYKIAYTAKKFMALSKVIIETCLLTDEEKIAACLIAKAAGADFVKTSTGFSKAGANEHDIALMRFVVGADMGVKASGGVRSREDALRMIANGATRIGASAGIAILQGNTAEGNY